MRTLAAVLAVLLLCGAVFAQQDDDRKVRIRFKEASLDALIAYLSEVTPWTFVKAKSTSKKITAYSDNDVPLEKVLAFVDTALKPAGLATMKVQNVVVIDDDEKIRDKTHAIRVGSKPEEIEISDQMVVQIMPLQNVNVKEIEKELSSILKKAGDVAVNRHANVFVVSGRSQDIHRLAKILTVIDAQVNDQLKIEVLTLKNSDAVVMAKTLNELFKKEQTSNNNQGGFMGMMSRWFGGGRNRRRGSGDVQPESVASQIVRIIADERTNALLVTANEDNMVMVKDVVKRLDTEMAQAMRIRQFNLEYADANEVARVITDLFSAESPDQRSNRGRRGLPWFMGGRGNEGEAAARGREVRAVAETRTNMVIVLAHENDFTVIEDLIKELDRQITDVVRVVIYTLENAEAEDMAKILQEVFRSQINATRQSGRNTGQGGRGGGRNFWQAMMGRSGGNTRSSSGLPPAEEVEITSDSRTNAVIVKASDQYQLIAKQVIEDLDANPTEATSTYHIPVKNLDAEQLATMLRNLFRTGSTGGGARNQNRGMFGFNQGNRNQGTTRNRNQGSTRGGRGSGGRRRLGPLDFEQDFGDFQDEGVPFQDEEQERRSVEGQVDIQADPDTNSLVIRTSPRNFEAIQRLIDDMDRMRPQVLIKVLIAEVTLTEGLEFGVEGFWENKMTVGGGDKATNRVGSDLGVGSEGFTYLLSGDEFQATLNMFSEDGRLEVLATPRILVLDNQTANINVGKEVPIITNSQVTQQGNTINTVQYESVGILLEVQPHINPDGLVTMVVHPEISDVASEAEAVEITEGVTNPTFLVNSADTTVSVRNGQTVVIGGLIRETTDEAVSKVPILGDIPLLGSLFSNTKERKVKRELMIFLTPYVVFTTEELEELTELEKSKLKLLDERDIEAEGDRWLDRIKDHTRK